MIVVYPTQFLESQRGSSLPCCMLLCFNFLRDVTGRGYAVPRPHSQLATVWQDCVLRDTVCLRGKDYSCLQTNNLKLRRGTRKRSPCRRYQYAYLFNLNVSKPKLLIYIYISQYIYIRICHHGSMNPIFLKKGTKILLQLLRNICEK